LCYGPAIHDFLRCGLNQNIHDRSRYESMAILIAVAAFCFGAYAWTTQAFIAATMAVADPSRPDSDTHGMLTEAGGNFSVRRH